MHILGIESSCDDTAAAVLMRGEVLSNILTSQDIIHNKFGGVVPELASRNHLQAINPVVEEALQRAGSDFSAIDLIAVTQGPGLIGSLLVGFSYAKALAHVTNIPLVGVDHMAGHILSIFLGNNRPQFPFISLIVSGGTSAIYLANNYTDFKCLGRTRDDAAGEAFDKVAKLLDLPYPGGPHVSKLAEKGSADHIRFPRSWLEEDSLDFSFSGLKTSVLNHVNKLNSQNLPIEKEHICASFEEAVVEVLVKKTIKASIKHNIPSVALGGGVSANQNLRCRLAAECEKNKKIFYAPELAYCSDNAAMIAFAGYHSYKQFGSMDIDQDVYSRSQLG